MAFSLAMITSAFAEDVPQEVITLIGDALKRDPTASFPIRIKDAKGKDWEIDSPKQTLPGKALQAFENMFQKGKSANIVKEVSKDAQGIKTYKITIP